MNLTFWLLAAVLLGIAFFIIIRPLLQNREIVGEDSEQTNIAIAHDRAEELKQQLQAGTLSQQQYDEQYAELELNLGDELDLKPVSQKLTASGKWMIVVILVSLPVYAILTYFALGEPDALIKAETKPVQSVQQGGQDINAMIAKLAQRLKDNPDNAQDWIMLGRSFKYVKQYQLALNSFKKARALLGDQPDVLLHYADALAMMNNGSLAGEAEQLVFKALEKSPKDPTGLWLAGMAKAEKQEFTQAVSYWRQLLRVLPSGSDSLKQVEGLIASVQARMENPGFVEQPGTTVQNQQNTAVSIEVQVNIEQSIKDRLTASDTVFIYAKALSGPPMPLAIVRKQVSDLPVTVLLNDAMAMMASQKLSNYKAVKVMARISKSGTAMPQAGDWVGSVELTELKQKQSVMIVINQQI